VLYTATMICHGNGSLGLAAGLVKHAYRICGVNAWLFMAGDETLPAAGSSWRVIGIVQQVGHKNRPTFGLKIAFIWDSGLKNLHFCLFFGFFKNRSTQFQDFAPEVTMSYLH